MYVAFVKKNVASDKHNKHKENRFVCFPNVVAVPYIITYALSLWMRHCEKRHYARLKLRCQEICSQAQSNGCYT